MHHIRVRLFLFRLFLIQVTRCYDLLFGEKSSQTTEENMHFSYAFWYSPLKISYISRTKSAYGAPTFFIPTFFYSGDTLL